MNLSEFGLAPPIPGSWWLHAALHASWPWHTALGADETSNEIEWRFHILPYSSIFIHILPSHLHDELLCTKFCQSLLALLRDSEVMFSSRVERIQNIQMPNQECKLGSVLHSQLEVVKEGAFDGPKLLWNADMNRSCQRFRGHVTSYDFFKSVISVHGWQVLGSMSIQYASIRASRRLKTSQTGNSLGLLSCSGLGVVCGKSKSMPATWQDLTRSDKSTQGREWHYIQLHLITSNYHVSQQATIATVLCANNWCSMCQIHAANSCEFVLPQGSESCCSRLRSFGPDILGEGCTQQR